MIEAGDFVLSLFLALVMAAICVMVHYEGLALLDRLEQREWRWFRHARHRVTVIMMGVLLLHLAEITLYAVLYGVLVWLGAAGGIVEPVPVVGQLATLDYLYYSTSVYASLGLGDMVPTGMFRMISGMESVLGLVMIAWSASFTFLTMQRLWKPRG